MTAATDDRQFLFDTWQKIQNKDKLNSIEKLMRKLFKMHPEFHPVLANANKYRDHEFDFNETDPFSHLGLHAIVMEMINSDSPSGLRALYDQRVNQTGNKHESQHDLMLAVFDWLVVGSTSESNAQDEAQFVDDLRIQFDLPKA